MKLNIDGIQAFVLIAELGSFQRAAERLNLTPTALSRRMQRLEDYLGLRLFDRTTRSVDLTVVGRNFLPQAARLVDELTRSVDQLKDMSRSSSGSVTLACMPSLAFYRLPMVIRKYAERYPGNRVRLLDRTGILVAEAVKQGQAEFGVMTLASRDADLVEEFLLDDPFMLFCLQGHPLSAFAKVTWKDLRGSDLISFGGASGNRVFLDHQLASKGIDVRGRFEVEQLSAAIGLVSAGVGVAILPESTLIAEQHPTIRQIPLVNPVIRRPIGLVMRRGATLSPAAKALHDMLVREFATVASRRVTGRRPGRGAR